MTTTTEERIAQIRERNAELFAKGFNTLTNDEMEELGGLIDELERLLHLQQNGF